MSTSLVFLILVTLLGISLAQNELHSRSRRAAMTFENSWPSEEGKFTYFYDNLNNDQKAVVEEAFKIFEKKTCLKFKEVDDPVKSDMNITTAGRWCHTFIGDDPGFEYAQPLTLEVPICTQSPGYVLHYVTLFLGMIHEHERIDRDDHIEFDPPSEAPPRNFNSGPNRFFARYYDYGAVTHDPVDKGWGPKIIPKIPYYASTMGQRSELSLADIVSLNFKYCGHCDEATDCLYRGFRPLVYKNHDRCTDAPCICTDGMTGFLCDKVAKIDDGNCSPDERIVTARSRYDKDVVFPECLEVNTFKPGDQCTWMIKNGVGYDANCTIKLWFEGNISVPGDSEFSTTCNNWVEIRMCGTGVPGQRFCTGKEKFIDLDGNESDVAYVTAPSVLVNFRSFKTELNKDIISGGFKLCYTRDCPRFQAGKEDVFCPRPDE